MSEQAENVWWLRRLAGHASDVGRIDWSQTQLLAGLACVPAVACVLAAGIVSGQPSLAVVMAGGAVSVGFGAFQQLTKYRLTPMVLAAVGMAVSAWIGSIVGGSAWQFELAITALWGLGFGMVTSLGQGAWWVGLQWVISLYVYSAHPARPTEAAERAAFVLIGGAVQAALLAVIWWLAHEPFTQKVSPDDPADLKWVQYSFWRSVLIRTAHGHYAWRVAITLTASMAVYRGWKFPNGYWIPMTAAIVLKPAFTDTLRRGAQRMAGTIAGAAAATLVIALMRPGPTLLAGMVVLTVWGCYALLRVNYAVYAIWITTYVVFLLALAGLPGPEVAVHRALGTMIGGALALLAHALAPRRPVKGWENL